MNATDPDGEAAFLIPLGIFVLKEIAGEVFERKTGLPAPTVKGLGKAAGKQIVKSTRSLRSGSWKKSTSANKAVSGGKCEYCQRRDATQGDHAKPFKSYKDEVNEGKRTLSDARKTANKSENNVPSCAPCNLEKGVKQLGTEPGRYNPPHPTERVRKMMDD